MSGMLRQQRSSAKCPYGRRREWLRLAAMSASAELRSQLAVATAGLSLTTRRVVVAARVRGSFAGFRANLSYRREHRLQKRALRFAEKASIAHLNGEKYGSIKVEYVRCEAQARSLDAQFKAAEAAASAAHAAEVARLDSGYAVVRETKAAAVTAAETAVTVMSVSLSAARREVRTLANDHAVVVVEHQTAVAIARATEATRRRDARRQQAEVLKGVGRGDAGIA